MDFTKLTGDALTTALSLNTSTASDAALAAALVPRTEALAELFAIETPTPDQADTAEAITASIAAIEAEQTTRVTAAKATADKWAASKAAFAASQADDTEAEDAAAAEAEAAAAAEAEAAAAAEAEAAVTAEAEAAVAAEAEAVEAEAVEAEAGVAAALTTAQKAAAAKAAAAKAAKGNTRPTVKGNGEVIITASSGVPKFSNGQVLGGLDEVAKALIETAKGFAPYDKAAAKAAFSTSGGAPVLHKHSVASFATGAPAHLTASPTTKDGDYGVAKMAVKEYIEALTASMHAAARGDEAAMTAAAWCSPSENVYTYIADYVVDGIATYPSVSAPRGGLNITTGPERSSQGTALDDFGWTQTEAQAEAKTVKPFEVIVCPDFVDHRLDAIGYAYKIPILTQKAYPEIVTDALRFAGVLYAHRANRRKITDAVALSNAVTFNGYGSSFTDSLEALSTIAMAERRRWNVGKNAIMEVKAPLLAQEVYRADMSRRNGIVKDSVSDSDIARHFADRRLAVEYVADWQEVSVESGHLILPGEFDVMMYPAGTFAVADEEVINLSAVYDAASLSVNEYTGVFFEQAYMMVQMGYGSSLVTVPINTAGEQGALVLTGFGDSSASGSF